MRQTRVTVASVSSSAPIIVNYHEVGFGIGFGLVISGTGTYKIEHTFDDLQDASITPTWFTHSVVSAANASTDGNYAFPIYALRLTCTAYTSGSGILTVRQGG